MYINYATCLLPLLTNRRLGVFRHPKQLYTYVGHLSYLTLALCDINMVRTAGLHTLEIALLTVIDLLYLAVSRRYYTQCVQPSYTDPSV